MAFPPKVVGIIGSQGRMATNIYRPLFSEIAQVIGSDIADPHGLSNQEVVESSDLVLFSILPLGDNASVIESLIPYAKPETLWLSGSSIQQVRDAPIDSVLTDGRLYARGVDTVLSTLWFPRLCDHCVVRQLFTDLANR